jgi:hypothetical protein
MAETRPEPFAQRTALARGAKAPGPANQPLITVPACAVPIFVFLHIPKTAGTTLRGVFNEMFGPYFHLYTAPHDEAVCADGRRAFEQPGYFDNIMMLAGHFARNSPVVRSISGRRTVFVSVMRDPVDRVVSHYDYVRRMGWHRLHNEIADKSLLQAFSGSEQFRGVCQNEQMRLMFGSRIETQHGETLKNNNYIIGTLDHLMPIARIVASLSGMPVIDEMPSFNRIDDLDGKKLVRAKDQPDFAEAAQAIRAANQMEYAFYTRVKAEMIVHMPDWGDFTAAAASGDHTLTNSAPTQGGLAAD